MRLRDENTVWVDGVERAMGDLDAGSLLGDRPDDGARIAAIGTGPDLIEAAIRFYRAGCDGLVLGREVASASLLELLAGEGYARVDLINGRGTSDEVRAGTRGRITVLTSGSTGTPKLVPHTWDSLFTAHRAQPPPRRWLVTYLPGTYAWYQLLTLAMFLPDQHLVTTADPEPEAMLEAAAAGGANAISATPTFWQYLLVKLGRDALTRIAPEQLSLGGEPVPQRVLDSLRAVFPSARISHIYASSEVGAAVVVHDGIEGFPMDWLVETPDVAPPRRGAQLYVLDGELLVRSSHAAGGTSEWVRTGDEAIARHGRVVIVGRKGADRLIIGGRKIHRDAVEAPIRDHPVVQWCRVGTRGTLAGAVVVADIVLNESAGMSPADAERELTSHARSAGLPEWAVPRMWRFSKEIPIGPNRKSPR